MNKYDFIGQIKFYDYRINHFGYLTIYNPTNIFNNDSLRITENSLVDKPNLYRDNSSILFNTIFIIFSAGYFWYYLFQDTQLTIIINNRIESEEG